MLLLLILSNYLMQTKLQYGDRIRELLLESPGAFLGSGGRALRLVEGLVVKLDGLVSLLQTLLELLDFKFKLFFLFLVFGLQGQDLVVRFVCVLAALDVVSVRDSGLLLNLSNLAVHLDNAILSK